MATSLTVENISFRYDKIKQAETLSNITFSINQGEWVAIVGHNGSGKSTLAQVLVGLLEAHQGKIVIAGHEMNNENKWQIRKHIGLLFQNPDNQFIGTTVQDDVAFALENRNMPYGEMKQRVDRAIDMVGMTDFKLADPSRLSGGQKQRVAIAGMLALQPSIIVLDEALVMLDPTSRRELIATLQQLKQQENITIISITHDMNEAAVADSIIMMEKGQIKKYDKPEIVFQTEPTLEPPFAEKLRRILLQNGGNVPDEYTSEKELERWICKSVSKV